MKLYRSLHPVSSNELFDVAIAYRKVCNTKSACSNFGSLLHKVSGHRQTQFAGKTDKLNKFGINARILRV